MTPLQARVDRLTFDCQDAEDAFVDAAQWLAADEPFQNLDAERERCVREVL